MDALEEIYSESERSIFRYYDGRGYVWGDPVALHRRLNSFCGGHLGDALEAARGGDPEVAFRATEDVLAAARKAFGMTAFDPQTGAGAMEEHVFRVLNDFADFCTQKKTPPGNSPTSSPPA